ncbi:MAG: hypothetical protein ACREYB_02700 [Casimicrobiaceae bacterium]
MLDARDAEFKRDQNTSLAVLYDPDTMPPSLVKAYSRSRSCGRRVICARRWQARLAERRRSRCVFVHPLSEIHEPFARKPRRRRARRCAYNRLTSIHFSHRMSNLLIMRKNIAIQ